jgi:hypothetical protein
MADAADATASTVKDAGAGLGKKLGPLPVWVWLAIVGSAAFLWYYFKGRGSSTSSTDTTDTSGATDEYGNPISTSDITGGDNVPGTYGAEYYNYVPDSTVTQPSTNDQWLTMYALPQAIKDGYNPVTAGNALSTYINGGTLSEDDSTLVTRVTGELTAQGINLPETPGASTVANSGSTVLFAPIVAKTRSKDKKSAAVSWNKVPGAVTYTVQVRSEPSVGSGQWSTWVNVATGIAGTKYTITPLQPSRAYQARVAAVAKDGTIGTYSNPV